MSKVESSKTENYEIMVSAGQMDKLFELSLTTSDAHFLDCNRGAHAKFRNALYFVIQNQAFGKSYSHQTFDAQTLANELLEILRTDSAEAFKDFLECKNVRFDKVREFAERDRRKLELGMRYGIWGL